MRQRSVEQLANIKVEATHTDLLRGHGFEVRTRTASHLIVETPRGNVDYYPGTGLWKVRGTNISGLGVFRLIAWALERAVRP